MDNSLPNYDLVFTTPSCVVNLIFISSYLGMKTELPGSSVYGFSHSMV